MKALVRFKANFKFGDYATDTHELEIEREATGITFPLGAVTRYVPYSEIKYIEYAIEKPAEKTTRAAKKPARQEACGESAKPQATRSKSTRPRKTPVRTAKKVRSRPKSE